jgi:Tfp pilus assembly protein PilF
MEPSGRKGGPKQITPSMEMALTEAQQLLYSQEYDAAIAKYELVLAMDPDNTKVMDTLAEVYLEVGAFERARDISFRFSSLLHSIYAINFAPHDESINFTLFCRFQLCKFGV